MDPFCYLTWLLKTAVHQILSAGSKCAASSLPFFLYNPRPFLTPPFINLMLDIQIIRVYNSVAVFSTKSNALFGSAAEKKEPALHRKEGMSLMKQHKKGLAIWLTAVLLLLIAALLSGSPGRSESVQEAMRDAVLHNVNRISLFGLKEVSPGLISAFLVTAILLLAAALIRVFAIPRFKLIPGKLQLVLEEAVGLFDRMAKTNSPHRCGFMGAYIFAAGAYIFVGTLFELLGIQAITTHGHSVTLPAPLSDVNAAIALGTLSYLVILSGGIAGNGPKGILKTLKEFSLPISMSFRLFGALLSGLLVTELVYYFVHLSFVLPVVVGVLFTLLHALIQTYVLTMLTALYYGEVSEPSHGQGKKTKKKTKSV